MAPCFGRLKVAGTPSFFRRNLPQPLARQGKSNSRPRERKKRFNQEKKERFRREKARFWEIGEKKERNSALDFSLKMSPLTRESMIHFLLLLAKKSRGVSHENKPLLFRSPTTVPCIHDKGTDVSGVPYQQKDMFVSAVKRPCPLP